MIQVTINLEVMPTMIVRTTMILTIYKNVNITSGYVK